MHLKAGCVTWAQALFCSQHHNEGWANAMSIKTQPLKKTSAVIKKRCLGEAQKNFHWGAQDTKRFTAVKAFSQIVVSNLRAHKIPSWWSFVVTTLGQSKWDRKWCIADRGTP